MRVLILGGSGYLGGMIGRYLEATDRVLCVHEHRRTYPGQQRPTWKSDTTVLHGDLRDPETLKALAYWRPEAIVHCVSLDQRESAENPFQTLDVNVGGGLGLLEACNSSDLQLVIYLSTVQVYGDLEGVVDEDTVVRPRNLYGLSHLFAEEAIAYGCRNSLAKSVVLRLSNSFGRPAHAHCRAWQLVVNDLCRQALAGGPVSLRSNGLAWRDFVPVNFLVETVGEILLCHEELSQDERLLVASGETMRLIDAAAVIAAAAEVELDVGGEMVHNLPPREPTPWQFQVQRMRQRFPGLQPEPFAAAVAAFLSNGGE